MTVSVKLQWTLRKLRAGIDKHRTNLIYSLLIFVNQFAYGTTANMLGTTLVDLSHIFHVSLNVASALPMAANIGYLIGSLASYLYRHFNRQLVLTLAVLLMALMVALLPHYGQMGVAIPAVILMGVGSGAWDSATAIWLVDMWPVGNSAILQASQFMYGLGSIGAPVLAGPFVYGDATEAGPDNHTLTTEERIASLSVPFTIAGLIQAAVPVALLVLFFLNRYEKISHKPLRNEPEDLECDGNRKDAADDDDDDDHHLEPNPSLEHNRPLKLLLCGLCLATYVAVENGHFSFSTALFQSLDIHLSAAKSAHVMSLLFTTYTLGRLTTAFISIRLQPDVIIGYHFGILFGALALLYHGQNDLWSVTVGTALFGYGFSAMWPALFAFTERHLRLTDQVCSFYSFLSGLVPMVIPVILSRSFTTNPAILFTLEAAFLTTSLVLFVTVKTWIELDRRRRSDRFAPKHKSASHVY